MALQNQMFSFFLLISFILSFVYNRVIFIWPISYLVFFFFGFPSLSFSVFVTVARLSRMKEHECGSYIWHRDRQGGETFPVQYGHYSRQLFQDRDGEINLILSLSSRRWIRAYILQIIPLYYIYCMYHLKSLSHSIHFNSYNNNWLKISMSSLRCRNQSPTVKKYTIQNLKDVIFYRYITVSGTRDAFFLSPFSAWHVIHTYTHTARWWHLIIPTWVAAILLVNWR